MDKPLCAQCGENYQGEIDRLQREANSLSQQLATANAACAAKDEALKALRIATLYMTPHPDYRHLCDAASLAAKDALSQTPAAAAQLAEEAAGFRRIKELVTDIRERLTRQNCEPIAILTELDKVIAQAKGGDTG